MKDMKSMKIRKPESRIQNPEYPALEIGFLVSWRLCVMITRAPDPNSDTDSRLNPEPRTLNPPTCSTCLHVNEAAVPSACF